MDLNVYEDDDDENVPEKPVPTRKQVSDALALARFYYECQAGDKREIIKNFTIFRTICMIR